MAAATTTMWFPLNESVSSSWPPKITFSPSPPPRGTSRRPRSAASADPDAMDGLITVHPQPPRSPTRSSTRVIPSRPSRAKVNVPSMPTSLWQHIPSSKGKGKETELLLAEPDECHRFLVAPGRIRSSSLEEVPTTACPARVSDAQRYAVRCIPPVPSTPEPPATGVGAYHLPPVLSIDAHPCVLTQWENDERTFSRLWSEQKRRNPRLPAVVSPLNPLRAHMPPFYARSVTATTTTRPFAKVVEWNFKKPRPSPEVQTKLRSRRECDAVAEQLPTKAFLGGKRFHCRACSRDPLLKRLLLLGHWIARADVIFEDALTSVEEEGDKGGIPSDAVAAEADFEMVVADDNEDVEDSFPKSVVFLRDRHDFDEIDDEDDALMGEPLVVERPSDSYSLHLF